MVKRTPPPLGLKDLIDQLLEYNTDTGEFIRKVHRGGPTAVGDIAGWVDHQGYRRICLGRRSYLAHVLAWVYAELPLPEDACIDHIDGNKLNNRLSNLRLATYSQNKMNQRLYKNNTSGITGVRCDKHSGKWIADIRANGKRFHLGRFLSKEEAVAARRQAAADLHGIFRYYE